MKSSHAEFAPAFLIRSDVKLISPHVIFPADLQPWTSSKHSVAPMVSAPPANSMHTPLISASPADIGQLPTIVMLFPSSLTTDSRYPASLQRLSGQSQMTSSTK